MVIRELRGEDFEVIDSVWRESRHAEHFGLPSLHNNITSAVVEDEKGFIGFGIVKIYAEAVAVLDLSKPKIDRLNALELLLREAFRACEEAKIEHLHVYVHDPGMQRVLIKRFDFRPATGVALVKEI